MRTAVIGESCAARTSTAHLFRASNGCVVRQLALILALAVGPSDAPGQTETIRVDLELRTGGALSGLVVEHTDHGLVVVHEETPYVFAWQELEPSSAFGARRALLSFERGGRDRLVAQDHFELGLMALTLGRKDLAAIEFRRAKRIDPTYAAQITIAVADFERRRAAAAVALPLDDEEPTPSVEGKADFDLAQRVHTELAGSRSSAIAPIPSTDHRTQILAVYREFGAKVREVLGPKVVLLESDHFLIWTDWEPRYRDRLTSWCEGMYAALCERFGLDPKDDVFIAKCPVFCWRSKRRFQEFAQQFDGHDGTQAVGYTRSIEESGHVHLVLLRQGRSEADFNRFACTLVHEGTHAFLHRLYSTRLIPHWINEGYADLTAERVLGDRCPNGENAALLSRPFARYKWPITELLNSAGPIDVHEYPLAHSVVAYLEGLGPRRFAGFIKRLKAGETVSVALADNFDNLTLDQLEARWRRATQASDPIAAPTTSESSTPLRAFDR